MALLARSRQSPWRTCRDTLTQTIRTVEDDRPGPVEHHLFSPIGPSHTSAPPFLSSVAASSTASVYGSPAFSSGHGADLAYFAHSFEPSGSAEPATRPLPVLPSSQGPISSPYYGKPSPPSARGPSSAEPRPARSQIAVPLQDRPFKCDECAQSFNRNHDLKRHKRIHLKVKPFPCGACPKTFSRKDALNRHRLVRRCGQLAAQSSTAAVAAAAVAGMVRPSPPLPSPSSSRDLGSEGVAEGGGVDPSDGPLLSSSSQQAYYPGAPRSTNAEQGFAVATENHQPSSPYTHLDLVDSPSSTSDSGSPDLPSRPQPHAFASQPTSSASPSCGPATSPAPFYYRDDLSYDSSPGPEQQQHHFPSPNLRTHYFEQHQQPPPRYHHPYLVQHHQAVGGVYHGQLPSPPLGDTFSYHVPSLPADRHHQSGHPAARHHHVDFSSVFQ
jgi:hypothetical protein